MADEIFKTLLSFVLLTVVGGVLGAALQHRSWKYKWSLESKEKRLSISRDVFQEVSRLMDKRLFRSRQLHLWLKRGESEKIEKALTDCRSCLFEWNDSINRNLAMLEFYFSRDIRNFLDFRVCKMFVDVGARIDDERQSHKEGNKIDYTQVDDDLAKLQLAVCDFNIQMLREIEKYS